VIYADPRDVEDARADERKMDANSRGWTRRFWTCSVVNSGAVVVEEGTAGSGGQSR
jgi:hypothetical protein